MNKKSYNFIFDWILIEKLAVGNSPLERKNLDFLKKKGVKNILGLCSANEIEWDSEIKNFFNCERIYIPDSNSNKLLSFEDLEEAYNCLINFIDEDTTFLHCFASVERSPILCILYIMKKFNMRIEDALDYVKRKHKLTNHKNFQLKLIKEFALAY